MPAPPLSRDEFDAWLLPVRPGLLSYALRRTHPDDAENLVQSACLIAWQIHDRFDPDTGASGFCAWLLAILDRACLEYHRRNVLREEIALPPEDLSPLVEADAAPSVLPLHEMEARLKRAGLTERQRVCLLGAHYGYTTREIAQALGIAQSTVAGHIAAGRKRFLAHWEGEIAREMLAFWRECARVVKYRRPQTLGSYLARQHLRRLAAADQRRQPK